MYNRAMCPIYKITLIKSLDYDIIHEMLEYKKNCIIYLICDKEKRMRNNF